MVLISNLCKYCNLSDMRGCARGRWVALWYVFVTIIFWGEFAGGCGQDVEEDGKSSAVHDWVLFLSIDLSRPSLALLGQCSRMACVGFGSHGNACVWICFRYIRKSIIKCRGTDHLVFNSCKLQLQWYAWVCSGSVGGLVIRNCENIFYGVLAGD